MLNRRELLQWTLASSPLALLKGQTGADARPDYTLEIAPYTLELSPRSTIQTIAYNSQVPGPLIRLQDGKPVTIEVRNRTKNNEVVHWHGLAIPSDVDGAMEEGTPLIPPGQQARYTYTPCPSGFRWYHTHTFAGRDLKKAQYTGQHGFLFVEARENPGRYDAEFFLALHDWKSQLIPSDDGSMNPFYEVSTINGRVLGFGEPLRVKAGQRAVLHILNSSPTEVHWVGLAGHTFEVIALDGNALAAPVRVPMLRLAPAERVSAIVEMNNPGVWVLGEVRKHIHAGGMGIVLEYAGQSGQPRWIQPETLDWSYRQFGTASENRKDCIEIPLVFRSKFTGHGDMDHWTINGKSFPHTDTVTLHEGQRYRLVFKNASVDDHPVHLHRHVFKLTDCGVMKDTVIAPAKQDMSVEFVANNPGPTLFHCHQQNHMDAGFMMLFRYA